MNMLHAFRSLGRLVVGTSALALVMAMALVSPSAAGGARTTSYSPNPSSHENQLLSVSAISSTDAWAVGYYVHNKTGILRTLTLHWDGTKWTRVWSPNGSNESPAACAALPCASRLRGVSAISPTDVWAVGDYLDTDKGYRTLTLHWDGVRWLRVRSPNGGPNGGSSISLLQGVTAVSSSDVWAAGFYENAVTQSYKTLMLHWNGVRWAKVWSPNPTHFGSELYAVSASSATDIWAVGDSNINACEDPNIPCYGYLILHWNGSKWSSVISDFGDVATGVSAVSPTNVWVAGYGYVLHWNGVLWSPIPGGELAIAASTGDVWTVGDNKIFHWNGSKWSLSWSDPGSGVGNMALNGVSLLSPTDAWAVGQSRADSSHPFKTLILHWDGTSWTRT